jgi:hypothetical protein
MYDTRGTAADLETLVTTWLVIALVAGAICAIFGRMLGDTKGRPILGLFLGLFFGPIGLLVAVLLPVKDAPPPPTTIGPSPSPRAKSLLEMDVLPFVRRMLRKGQGIVPREWYVQAGGEQYGPLPFVQLRRCAVEGRITADSLVREKDGGQWVVASTVPGLFPPAVRPPSVPPPSDNCNNT